MAGRYLMFIRTMFTRTMFIRKTVLSLICLLPATPVWSKVLVHWTQPSVPPAATMGIRELVISWNSEALVRNAHGQGYHVYAEVPLAEVPATARATVKNEL